MRLLSFIFLFILSSNYANDWGPNGHRTTGQIAEHHLNKKAFKKINKLLQGESLAFVSTFADQIKSDKKYNKFYSWHYVNMPLDGNYKTSEKNPKGDLITGINFCIETLKDDNASSEDKQFYLKMLVHLIGDLHMPLHVGRKEDKGGNTVKLQWFNKETNLHRVWDEEMIEEWNMSYIELANNAKDLNKEEVKQIQKGNVIDWLQDTHKLTKKIYDSAEDGENLKYRYSYDFFPVVRTQLQKGGIRLAKILNDIFS